MRELLPYDNTPIEMPFMEFDTGDRSSDVGARALVCRAAPTPTFWRRWTIRRRLPDEPLFCPSLNVRAFDNRSAARARPSSAALSTSRPTASGRTPYVPNNRPRVPPPDAEIHDELSEASEEEEEEDPAYRHYDSHISLRCTPTTLASSRS